MRDIRRADAFKLGAGGSQLHAPNTGRTMMRSFLNEDIDLGCYPLHGGIKDLECFSVESLSIWPNTY
ncbi:hypothetical protein [Methylobacterium oxalidis]|uniref:hypothetical protein n=1 Tax=Methylobacterium oxalidis TaxID=944322 RepID=UPI0011BDCDFF|nr:hypothetical protein [Methylobacterium oxalidis]